MAQKHILSLDIPETLNTKIFRVVDTSTYSTDLGITCNRLQILLPGYLEEVILEILPNSENVFNACTLHLQDTNCDAALSELPDGIYTVRYSVAPNDKVWIEYNYLRISQTLNTYYNILCSINLTGAEPLATEKEKLNKLRMLKMMLEGAKAKVEFCNNPEQGQLIFNYAKKQIDKLNCTYCN
jgi:hypothetical protein